jgi:hypothetical protein
VPLANLIYHTATHSSPVTEGYVQGILDPETRIAGLRAEAGDDGGRTDPGPVHAVHARIAAIEARLGELEADVRRRVLRSRGELLEDGVPVETYRRICLDEALGLLAQRTPGGAG